MKTSPVLIDLSGNFEQISIGGEPAVPAGTVTRADFDAFLVGSGIAIGAVQPKYAAEVGLAEVPEQPPGGALHQIALPTNATDPMLERGRLIVNETRKAVEGKDFGRLRQLCWWFPLVLRMPEVMACLDGLPLGRAQQVAGTRPGYGRPFDPAEAFGRVATMTALARERGVSIADAARALARAVPALNVMPCALENLHSDLGELVSCLDGYAVPASELSARPWGASGDDELPVYVRSPRE